ncbi:MULTISPECIES: ABC transporter permease [Meiothermus]|jgi:sodium transport system permease protein|uniref:Putative sodium ABC transporter permease protein n=1 Tax=Meiothermus ruber (strain ATCC 35948 / DSM 1279 / VKM B-1258 / 21) TaxID=504728 RepID=D3PSW7_MEIRD|nr:MULTISPECIES: ABC transporter permease [Meiothermus]ADD28550.1 putative sodium ABC transporter, permease protein [Meiothermus ruber DSM 1279]AGK06007.1 putative sodium ABC transporter permease protein [Meiothermus ruber DSM 1279]KIQ54263.1 sodium ABC transporter permease [Meiothermus taiwanensis]GAO75511.1 putative sodium ABC transporter, permease protein [Meiothermus ruber H328]
MNEILIIARKELLSVVRERRVLFTTLVLPILIMPLLMFGPILLFGNAARQTQESVQKVGVVGVPTVVLEELRKARVEPIEVANPQEAVQNREVQAALVFENGRYIIYGRLSSGATQSALVVEKVQAALRAYKDQVVAEQLRARGIGTDILEPFSVETQDASREQERAAGLFAFLIPFFLVSFIQAGGMPVAVDATAGEKEKGTLEALLAAPVPLIQVLLGKGLAVFVMSLLSTFAAVAGLLLGGGVFRNLFAAQLQAVQNGENQAQLGGALALDPLGYLAILVTAVLFALLIIAIMISLGLYARSFKEAQSYLSPLSLVMLIPLLFLQFSDFLKLQDWYFALPLVNVMLALDAIVKGAATATQLLITWASTLAYGALALHLAYRNFQREDVVFRN